MPTEIAPGLEVETVGDLIGGDTESVATPFDPPTLPGKPKFPEPGIYFGMPEDTYHAIHACSASGTKKMSASSMDYWASSVLNQDREDEETTFKALGRAYHCRICEGAEAFLKNYAVELEKSAFDPVIVTIAEIRAAIERLGGKPKGTVKGDLIQQLLDLWPDAPVWDVLVERHAEENKGKTFISAKNARRIEIANAMIVFDPQLKDAFTGGHAEVSLFWHDKATGVPMKARLDYLKLLMLVDLKSFSNPMGKPVQRAIDAAISNNKYYIPVAVYLDGIAAVKELVKARKDGAVFGFNMTADQFTAAVDWAWKWAHQPEPEVLFVFQQTGVAPVTRGRIMRRGTTYALTRSAVHFLIAKWGKCAKAYGVDPWIDAEAITATEDEQMSFYATDFGEQA